MRMIRSAAVAFAAALLPVASTQVRADPPPPPPPPSSPSSPAQNLYMRVVDVGNALCVVIRAPGGHHMLYDAGDFKNLNCLKAVQEIVGHDRIDLVVLSHSDADHIGNMSAILKAYKGRVDTLVFTGRKGTSKTTWPTMVATMNAATTKPGTVWNLGDTPLPNTIDPQPGQQRAAPQTYDLGDAKVTLVAGWHDWPYDKTPFDSGEQNNIISLVVRIEYGGKSVLLTGDTIGRIGAEDDPKACRGAEEWMTKYAAPYLKSTVLIGQHHGGDNSSAACFIKAVKPDYLVLPAGRVKNHDHPRAAVVERYLDWGLPAARIFRTDRGDDQGPKEWDGERIKGCKDGAGDDDVAIYLPKSQYAKPLVQYIGPNGPCTVPTGSGPRRR